MLPSLANRKQKFDVINFKLWLPAPIRSISMWFMVFSGLPFFLRRNTICEENYTTFSHVVESFQFVHKCIVRFARTSQTKHWARWVNRIWHLLRVFIINYVRYFAYHNFCIGCSHAVMCVPVCFVETREEKEAKKNYQIRIEYLWLGLVSFEPLLNANELNCACWIAWFP